MRNTTGNVAQRSAGSAGQRHGRANEGEVRAGEHAVFVMTYSASNQAPPQQPDVEQALRETEEEVGIPRSQIKVFGQLPALTTVRLPLTEAGARAGRRRGGGAWTTGPGRGGPSALGPRGAGSFTHRRDLAAGRYVAVNREAVGGLVFVSLFPSVLSYLFWNRGITLIGANRAGLFLNLVPILTAVMAYLFLGEILAWYHFAGLALVIGGMLLFNLDMAGICVSGGSACSSGASSVSHVIKTLYGPEGENLVPIRFSFSHGNTREEVDYVITKLKELV